ncbi:MAG: hypothetical protein E6R04_02665 [Spirochaetes bacterium]|nr:MAG: hypothetical protein E6R04_02665 [Spirochaetota bacterium]
MKSTSTTGIGVRGGTLQIGGASTQPIPFVQPSAAPVAKPSNPIVPVVAPASVANPLQKGQVPLLAIPVSSVVNGTMGTATQAIIPRSLGAIQFRPSSPALGTFRIPTPVLAPQRKPNQETLSFANLVVANGNFQPADPNGISRLRPEIIALMDFFPVYVGDTRSMNKNGVFMEMQYQTRHLREQTLFQLMEGVKRFDQNQELQLVQTEFTENFDKVNSAAEFYRNSIVTLEAVKNGFDVKSIPPANFDLKTFKTLRDFYQVFMLFPKEAFDRFSGTKILQQLIFDTRSIAEGYSMNLLNLSDPDRSESGSATLSPVAIDKSYTSRNGFGFTPDTIRSFGAAVNASDPYFFGRFNSSLPQTPDDRIKLLLALFSKELRVSRGLGRTVVTNLLRQKFGASTTDGSPFDNLLGGVGSTIFEPVTGPNSIAALTLVNDTPGSAVLPFETKYIDFNSATQKTYIPGTTFFADSILKVDTLSTFNLQPLRSYVEQYSDTIDNSTVVINNLFDFGDAPSSMSMVGVMKKFLAAALRGIAGLRSNLTSGVTGTGNYGIKVADATMAAIIRMASSDETLKSLVFQYLLLSILHDQTPKFFCDGIIADIGSDIRNLNGVVLAEDAPTPNLKNRSEVSFHRTALGTAIQRRVSLLVTQNENINPAQHHSRRTNTATGQIVVGFDTDTVYGIPNAMEVSELTKGFVGIFTGVENALGNETTNLLDSLKRTRFNSYSVTTLVLVAYEAFLQLMTRYSKVEFQSSGVNTNFPEMVVDSAFCARSAAAMETIINEPELPLPILPASSSSSAISPAKRAIAQRFARNHKATAAENVVGSAQEVANATGQSIASIQEAIMSNASVLTGLHATAGSRFTDAASLALRGVSGAANRGDLVDALAFDQSLNSIGYKLFQEDFAIACAFHIFLTIKKRLRGALDVANNYFTPQTLESLTSAGVTSVGDITSNLSPAQVRLIVKERDELVRKLTANSQQLQFIPASPTDTGTRNAILSLLNQEQFRETSNAGLRQRLLTVGIPSTFSKNLAERLNGSSIDSTTFQRKKEYDVVAVKVYKRSLEYPQLVFKPQRFLFDLSLFSNGYDNLGVQPEEKFGTVLKRIELLDYQAMSKPTVVTVENVVDSDAYSFLTSSQREEIVRNHVVSDLLASYIQFLTTIKVNESTFVDMSSQTYQNLSRANGVDLTPRVSELIRKYLLEKRTDEIRRNPALQPLPDISIEEMLRSPVVDQPTKDILRLLTYGNLAFKVENAMATILSPKLFERLFTIPVDVDGFEIDYTATTTDESGRELLEKGFLREKLDKQALVDGIYKLIPRTGEDVVFEDFFITIELVQS